MQSKLVAVIHRGSMLMTAAMVLIVQSVPADAVVRTTLSFFADNDIRQGEVGASGTKFDSDLGEFVSSSVRSCCFPVTAATVSGPPFTIRRTFSSLDTVNQIYYMGVSTVAEQDHLVIALNTAFSSSLVGKEFSTAFMGFSETQLIADLFGQFDQSLSVEQRIAAGERIGAFQAEVFSLDAGFGLMDRFALTSFSTGNRAGTGFAGPPPSAVPEPATWAMFIGGFGLVAGALRGRRRTIVRFA